MTKHIPWADIIAYCIFSIALGAGIWGLVTILIYAF